MDDYQFLSFVMSLLVLVRRNSSYNTIRNLTFLIRRAKVRRIHFRHLHILGLLYLRRIQNTPDRTPRQVWVLPRPQHWFQMLLNTRALDQWWKENFRVYRETFHFICRIVGPAIVREDTQMRAALPVETRVAVSLWRLATGECYRSCGLMLGISKPSAVYCCHEVVRELCALKENFIKFPTTPEELEDKIKGFNEKTKIPNVVGAIDGTHIPIKAPEENHEDYFNRKHHYSFVAQGIVDSTGLFMSVSTGYPGSIHDARVLRLTEVFRMAEDEIILTAPTMEVNGTDLRPLILGDSAYPLKPWLLCPFRNNGALNDDQKKFNKELSKGRVISEHAFGLTKGRWRVLLKRLDEDSERVPNTIIACCVLHNICIMMNDIFEPEDNNEENDDEEYFGGIPGESGQIVRQAIVEYLADN